MRSGDLLARRTTSALLSALRADSSDLETAIREGIEREYPWVEEAEPGWCDVTWFAGTEQGERAVLVAGTMIGYPSASAETAAFEPVPGTGISALTLRLPADALFSYRIARAAGLRRDSTIDRDRWFALAAAGEPDEFARETSVEFDGRISSVVRLPSARDDQWPGDEQGVRRGRAGRADFASVALQRDVRVWTWHPSDVRPGTMRLVLLDGELWNEGAQLAALLDRWVSEGVIEPLVVIMPEGGSPETRMREMTLRPAYLDFLDELLEHVDPDLTHDDPVAIGGWSLGGLTAAYAAISRPRFRTVLSVSGSFWWPQGTPLDRGAEAASSLLAVADVDPARWYLEVGLGERVQLAQHRHFATVARARGHHVTEVEHGGAHDVLNARIGIAHGLVDLFGNR